MEVKRDSANAEIIGRMLCDKKNAIECRNQASMLTKSGNLAIGDEELHVERYVDWERAERKRKEWRKEARFMAFMVVVGIIPWWLK